MNKKIFMMNKLISGALFSVRAADSQRLRAQIRERELLPTGGSPTDICRFDDVGEEMAEAFRKFDPDKSKMLALVMETNKR